MEFSADTHIVLDNPRCPICGCQAKVYQLKNRTLFDGHCAVCGPVLITPDAADYARKWGAHLLAAYVRRRSDPNKKVMFAITEVKQVIDDSPSFTPLEKLDMCLRLISERTPVPGQPSAVDYKCDYPLIYAVNREELLFYIKQLGDLGYVMVDGGSLAKLTASGYKRLQELQQTSTFSNTCFVAMSFATDLKPVYEQAIKPAVADAGFRPFIMWQHEHVNRIDDEIIAQIRKSRFMIADFTRQNPGAYFEAGFMQGLGRPVLWMCEASERDKLHFDTRQYNHILYTDLADARTRLHNRIVAVVGEGKGPELP